MSKAIGPTSSPYLDLITETLDCVPPNTYIGVDPAKGEDQTISFTPLKDVHEAMDKPDWVEPVFVTEIPLLERENEALKGELYHLRRCLEKLRTLHQPKCTHHCPDWDGLRINEFDPEFNACTCNWDHLK